MITIRKTKFNGPQNKANTIYNNSRIFNTQNETKSQENSLQLLVWFHVIQMLAIVSCVASYPEFMLIGHFFLGEMLITINISLVEQMLYFVQSSFFEAWNAQFAITMLFSVMNNRFNFTVPHTSINKHLLLIYTG